MKFFASLIITDFGGLWERLTTEDTEDTVFQSMKWEYLMVHPG